MNQIKAEDSDPARLSRLRFMQRLFLFFGVIAIPTGLALIILIFFLDDRQNQVSNIPLFLIINF